MNSAAFDVQIPDDYRPPKKDVEVAWILAHHYRAIIQVLKPINRYKVRTPDFYFLGKYYELKVMTSSQTRQLLVLLKRASQQSDNIIIDLRNTKITQKRATILCRDFLKRHPRYTISLVISAKVVVDINQ